MAEDVRRQTMITTNVRQQDYYESRYEALASGRGAEERAANRATRAWTRLRRKTMQLRATAGVDDELLALHRTWLGNLRDARVLDLGCFAGNRLSFWIAESAAEYVGVDLSQHAIAELNQKLRARNLPNAKGIAMDFLANEWPDGHFDVVYAYSVLHHFAELDVALAELRRILKPGGIIISMDPMAVDPFNRVARLLYRPFQTDRDWEFPFNPPTFDSFRRHFEIDALQGLQGAVKLAYPFLMIPGLHRMGRVLASRLQAWDSRHGRSFGPTFYFCWHVAMRLRRPSEENTPSERG